MKKEAITLVTKALNRLSGYDIIDVVKDTATQVYYKNNPDGTLRWVWPVELSNPLFLKFYNTATFRAKCIAIAIRLVFFLRLQKYFANGILTIEQNVAEKALLQRLLGKYWAMFAGTEGINQTALVYTEKDHVFFKIPVGTHADFALAHEVQNMHTIKSLSLNFTITPKFKVVNEQVLRLTDVSGFGKRSPVLITTHWQTLNEIADSTATNKTIADTAFWKQTVDNVEQLSKSNDSRLPHGLVKKLQLLVNTINTSEEITVGLSHGDFTPWNMYVANNSIMLYDWEMAQNDMPLLFDAFHFVYQQETLVTSKGFANLSDELIRSMATTEAKQIIFKYNVNTQLNHKLYLLYTVSSFVTMYVQQTVWQEQINKSILMWNLAIDKYATTQKLNERQLVLIDVFDFLQDKKYAALKWFDAAPECLDVFADVDLCVKRADTKALVNFINNHPLVQKVKVKRKSYMMQCYITLSNDSFLSVDCIWNFKRKSTQILDATTLLENTVENCNKVKIPSIEFDFYYTWMFYTLNGASIPDKYKEYFIRFGTVLNQKMQATFGIANYRDLINNSCYSTASANTLVNAMHENKGIKSFINKIVYVFDAIKEVGFQRGFIITFSGVDGAGKSTVIEKLRFTLEKKYRRKVVVLRHRPSVLPMLSAFTKGGRKAAELNAANTLPRQGTNNNIISSLLRFGYYYADYFFGQFYIYFKYVLRGNIVLFDRYYFDFINDSKRSNIALPKAFIQFGYSFLIKPRYNFFLYANEEIILERKKELDAETVKQLTKKYLSLFDKLSAQPGNSVYMPIENIKLDNTLTIIDNQIKAAA